MAFANDTDAPLGHVYVMHLDDRPALGIGTLGRGLWRERRGLESIAVAPLSTGGNICTVAPSLDGKILVLQDGKVVLLDRDLNARLVAELPPVWGWTVAWIDASTGTTGGSDGLRSLDIESGRVNRHVQSPFKLPDWEFTTTARSFATARAGFCAASTVDWYAFSAIFALEAAPVLDIVQDCAIAIYLSMSGGGTVFTVT